MVDLYMAKEDDRLFEANQLTADNALPVAIWCGGVNVVEHDAFFHNQTFQAINVPTAEGMVRAQEGDYIVRSPSGSFYVMKAAEFQEAFDTVK